MGPSRAFLNEEQSDGDPDDAANVSLNAECAPANVSTICVLMLQRAVEGLWTDPLH